MKTPEEVYKRAKRLVTEQYWMAAILDLDKLKADLIGAHPDINWGGGATVAYHTGLIAGILTSLFELDTIAEELGVKEVEYVMDKSNELIEAPDCEL